MRHAFDFISVEQAQSQTPAAGPLRISRQDVVLLTLALPPVLLVIWLCAIQHNWQRGLAAVKHSVCLGPAAGRPLFLAGSAAGFVLILGVTIIGGPANAAGVLSQRMIWVLILLPEIAWAAPAAVACMLLPVREVCAQLPARYPPARRGAFD